MFGHVVNVLGPVWSARIISLTTIFVEILADTFAFGRKLGHSTVHWLSGASRVWLFMRENIGPLPSSAVANFETNSNVTWTFDLSNMTLRYVDETYESSENEIIDIRRLPWLSAKIIINGGNEYELDTFGSNFRFIAPRSVKPTPKLLLSCWSVWSGIWLLPGQDARFEIINEDGEEETFFIHSRPSNEVDRWSDLFEIEDEEEEEEDDENEEDGEEKGGEENEEEDDSEGESDEGNSEEANDGDADDENSDSSGPEIIEKSKDE